MHRRGSFIPATDAVSGTFDSVRSAVFPTHIPVARDRNRRAPGTKHVVIAGDFTGGAPDALRMKIEMSVDRALRECRRRDPTRPPPQGRRLPPVHPASSRPDRVVNPRLFGSAAIGGRLREHKKQNAGRQTLFATLRQMPHNHGPRRSVNIAARRQPAWQCWRTRCFSSQYRPAWAIGTRAILLINVNSRVDAASGKTRRIRYQTHGEIRAGRKRRSCAAPRPAKPGAAPRSRIRAIPARRIEIVARSRTAKAEAVCC